MLFRNCSVSRTPTFKGLITFQIQHCVKPCSPRPIQTPVQISIKSDNLNVSRPINCRKKKLLFIRCRIIKSSQNGNIPTYFHMFRNKIFYIPLSNLLYYFITVYLSQIKIKPNPYVLSYLINQEILSRYLTEMKL